MRNADSTAKGPHHVQKDRLLVELELSSASVVYGWLFAQRSARLSDALNDSRDFIPFEQIDGEVVIIAKPSISKVIEICNVTAILNEPNPYRVLGARPNDDIDTVRKRYHDLLSRCHPDKFASRDPSEQFLEILRTVTQALVENFDKIRNKSDTAGVTAPEEPANEPA